MARLTPDDIDQAAAVDLPGSIFDTVINNMSVCALAIARALTTHSLDRETVERLHEVVGTIDTTVRACQQTALARAIAATA